ncbi:MAG TPA: HAMP domain-containing protein, partial [Terriglobales bacterium]|nr:HAMP domain-containing protein [Terriglobales bacterium]
MRSSGLLSRLPLSVKILLPIVVAVAVGYTASTWVSSQKSSDLLTSLAADQGQEIAKSRAATMQVMFNTNYQIAYNIRDAYIGMRAEKSLTRTALIAAMRAAIKANPQLVGIWAGFQPDAFDGNDKAAIGSEGADATGRFVPYIYPKDGGVQLDPMASLDKTDSSGDFYQIPLKSGQDTVLEPYIYPVAGKDTLLVSLAAPVMVDGKVIGVVGVDISLNQMNEDLTKVRPYDTGSVSVISSGGLFAASIASKNLGKPFADASPKFPAALPRIQNGDSFTIEDYSDALQTEVTRVLIPLYIGKAPKPWSVMVNLPQNKILAPVHEIVTTNLIIAVVIVVLLAVVIMLLVRFVATKPITNLTRSVEVLANGDTNVNVPMTTRGDELGVMAKAVEFFRQKLIEIEDLRHQQEETERTATAERRRVMLDMADNFESSVKGIVQSVSSSATELESNAQSMSSVADASARQATAVAAAATQASANVTTVAAAAEELSS